MKRFMFYVVPVLFLCAFACLGCLSAGNGKGKESGGEIVVIPVADVWDRMYAFPRNYNKDEYCVAPKEIGLSWRFECGADGLEVEDIRLSQADFRIMLKEKSQNATRLNGRLYALTPRIRRRSVGDLDEYEIQLPLRMLVRGTNAPDHDFLWFHFVRYKVVVRDRRIVSSCMIK